MNARRFEVEWRGGRRTFEGVKFDDPAPYLAAYKALGGWSVMCVWFNPDGGFREPFEVLERGFLDIDAATIAGKRLSSVTGLEFSQWP